MSMISAQIDELRKWADQLSERENEFGVVVRALVAALRDAADTIWQLRDDLQRAHGLLGEADREESRAWDRVRKAEAEADRLREQTERLVTLLRVDCDIDASWDGLRRFWSIGLTENGCLMRDRACKAEAEADRLRELASELWVSCPVHDSDCDECQHKGGRTGCELYDRMRELGVDG